MAVMLNREGRIELRLSVMGSCQGRQHLWEGFRELATATRGEVLVVPQRIAKELEGGQALPLVFQVHRVNALARGVSLASLLEASWAEGAAQSSVRLPFDALITCIDLADQGEEMTAHTLALTRQLLTLAPYAKGPIGLPLVIFAYGHVYDLGEDLQEILAEFEAQPHTKLVRASKVNGRLVREMLGELDQGLRQVWERHPPLSEPPWPHQELPQHVQNLAGEACDGLAKQDLHQRAYAGRELAMLYLDAERYETGSKLLKEAFDLVPGAIWPLLAAKAPAPSGLSPLAELAVAGRGPRIAVGSQVKASSMLGLGEYEERWQRRNTMGFAVLDDGAMWHADDRGLVSQEVGAEAERWIERDEWRALAARPLGNDYVLALGPEVELFSVSQRLLVKEVPLTHDEGRRRPLYRLFLDGRPPQRLRARANMTGTQAVVCCELGAMVYELPSLRSLGIIEREDILDATFHGQGLLLVLEGGALASWSPQWPVLEYEAQLGFRCEAAALTDSGKQVATLSRRAGRQEVGIYDLAQGQLPLMEVATEGVSGLKLGPQGERLLAFGERTELWQRSAADNLERASLLPAAPYAPREAAFSPNGRWVVSLASLANSGAAQLCLWG